MVIHRQVKPTPDRNETIIRAFDFLLIGVTYSVIGLFFFAQLFFGKASISPVKLCLTGAIALAIGVVLQLVWDDKPVTEPL
jgi:hypothetical protein